MGKKSKAAKAKTKAAAAPGAPSALGTNNWTSDGCCSRVIDIRQPHPLKGVTNSNDDPTRCAACSTFFFLHDLGNAGHSVCCGRSVCLSCFADEVKLNCPQCNALFDFAPFDFGTIARLKKLSKKGHPWAQVALAGFYFLGSGIRQSDTEALHWHRQAAKRGHPQSMEMLGKCFLRGVFGCPVDLHQAQEYFEACLNPSNFLSTSIYDSCLENLVEIAELHFEAKSFEKAKAILLPLAEDGVGKAQKALGNAILGGMLTDSGEMPSLREKQNTFSSALLWYSSASFAPAGEEAALGNAEHGAMICCEELQKFAQAKLWARFVKKTRSFPGINNEARIARVRVLVRLQRALRALRDVCGGCGAEFEGKERKFCRACRAYCYCSRECQKMHWNRKKGGHREDCKGASELKQKMKEKKKAEAIQASESKFESSTTT